MRYFHTSIQILKDISTRPTKYFILLVLSIIGLFFLAYMHNYNIVYLVMFFVFALAGASSIIGRFNLYRLEASVLAAENFFANTRSSYTLSIYNPHENQDSFALECTNHDSTAYINELKSLQSKSIKLEYTPSKRGKFFLPKLQLGTHFPLPHEMLFRLIDLNYEAIAYPEPKGESLEKFSSKNSSFIGEYEDFEGLHQFKEGESISVIYWPSVAKGGELMSKKFETVHSSKHLHFYFLKAGDEDETRLSQLCLWAMQCKEKNINYTMHFPSTTLNSTKRSHYEILQFLATY